MGDIGLWGKEGGEKGKIVGNDIGEVDGKDCLISLPFIPTLLSFYCTAPDSISGVDFFFQGKKKKKNENQTTEFHDTVVIFQPRRGCCLDE